jgi:type I restriction enzyme M protein
MLTAETKRRLDACRDILVGKLPLPTDQIELITLALIYKFMDDLDEESVRLGGKRSFFVGPLEKYRWRALLPQTVSADERMNLFAEGIEAIGKAEHLPALFRDIFRNSFLKFRDGRILTLFLNEVNGFVYSHSEELGNAFEYLLKTMGIQAENGQFRTPRHIIDFMVACLDPQPSDRILDPACGTGGFLVSCYKHILAQHTSPGSTIAGNKLTHEQRQKVYSNLTGYDVTDLMVKLSKVNLFLHGFPDPAIHIYDTLTNDARWNEKADLILANPPFMTPKGGVSPHTKFRVAAKKSEVLFTDYIAEHLTPDGRGCVIVPNGIVATTQNAYIKLRKFLVEDSLVAVVSLPAGVFKPYAGVKTSILLLDKTLARQRQEILFVKVNADGFDLGDKRLPIDANDLPEAKRVYTAWVTNRLNGLKTAVPWSVVKKHTLLSDRRIDLIAERFTDAPSATSQYRPVRLGDACERIMDGTHFSPKNQAQGKYRYITAKNIKPMRLCLDDVTYISEEAHREIYRRCPVKEGDVLYIKDGATTGIAAINTLEEEFSLLSSVAVLRGKADLLDNRFLAYWLNSPHGKNYMLGMVAGVAITRLTLAKLNDAMIPLPPIEEQRRIVEEIDRYQSDVVRLESEIAAKRKRMEAAIDAVWQGNSRADNGSELVRPDAR